MTPAGAVGTAFTGAHLIAVIVLLVVLWILAHAWVTATVQKYQIRMDARLENRRQYRAELAARRGPRIRGCRCDCHRLTVVR